jgi:hypothetical protein
MFNCGLCGKSSKPGEKQQRVVTSVRDKVYDCMVKDEKSKPGFRKLVPAQRPGREIVLEVAACPSCASKARTVLSKRGNPTLTTVPIPV